MLVPRRRKNAVQSPLDLALDVEPDTVLPRVRSPRPSLWRRLEYHASDIEWMAIISLRLVLQEPSRYLRPDSGGAAQYSRALADFGLMSRRADCWRRSSDWLVGDEPRKSRRTGSCRFHTEQTAVAKDRREAWIIQKKRSSRPRRPWRNDTKREK